MKERFEPGKTFEETYPIYSHWEFLGAWTRVMGWIVRLGRKAAAESPRGAEDQETRAAREDSAVAAFDEREPLQGQTTTCDVSGWGGPLPRKDGAREDMNDNRLISIYLWTDRRSRRS